MAQINLKIDTLPTVMATVQKEKPGKCTVNENAQISTVFPEHWEGRLS
jgi:hypothetical protein